MCTPQRRSLCFHFKYCDSVGGPLSRSIVFTACLAAEYRAGEHAAEREGPGSADGHDSHVGSARRPPAQSAADGTGDQQVLLPGARSHRRLARSTGDRWPARAGDHAPEKASRDVQGGSLHELLAECLLLPRRTFRRGNVRCRCRVSW